MFDFRVIIIIFAVIIGDGGGFRDILHDAVNDSWQEW